MDLTSKHCEERVAAGGKKEQIHDFEGSEQQVRIDTINSEDDFPYQFNYILVAIIEEETDQVELEFLNSVEEIGSKSFAHTHCEKRSTLINSEHKEAQDIATSAELKQIPLCEGTIVSIIQSIKTDLLEKKYYG